MIILYYLNVSQPCSQKFSNLIIRESKNSILTMLFIVRFACLLKLEYRAKKVKVRLGVRVRLRVRVIIFNGKSPIIYTSVVGCL